MNTRSQLALGGLCLFTFVLSGSVLIAEVLPNKVCATFGAADANRTAQCTETVCIQAHCGGCCYTIALGPFDTESKKIWAYSYDKCITLEGSNCETGSDDHCATRSDYADLNCGNWWWYCNTSRYETGC